MMTPPRAPIGPLLHAIAGCLLLCACATALPPAALNLSQQTSVQIAQNYLNGLTIFSAHFTQSGAFGASAGTLWIDRPGHMRLTYFGPAAQDMIAADGIVTIYDHRNGGVTTLPVARTPLGLLLAPHIALTGAVTVTGFHEDADVIELTTQDSTHPAQGTLAITLHRSPLQLTGVSATDVHGRVLTLALFDLNLHPVLTPALFRPPPAESPRS